MLIINIIAKVYEFNTLVFPSPGATSNAPLWNIIPINKTNTWLVNAAVSMWLRKGSLYGAHKICMTNKTDNTINAPEDCIKK